MPIPGTVTLPSRTSSLFGPDAGIRIDYARLTPDTAPSAILAEHRAAIRSAMLDVRRGSLSDAEFVALLSDATDLPAWNVRRALQHFGAIAPSPSAKVSKAKSVREGAARHKKVVAWLRKNKRWASVTEIAAGTGIPALRVRNVVRWEGHGFAKVVSRRPNGRPLYSYQLPGFAKAQKALA